MSRSTVTCPQCGARLLISAATLPNRRYTCPQCLQSFRPTGPVPQPNPLPALPSSRLAWEGRTFVLVLGACAVAVAVLLSGWRLLRRPAQPLSPVAGTGAADQSLQGSLPRGGREEEGTGDRGAVGSGDRSALLVGVREYGHARLPNLKYTENDVEELARLLHRPGASFAGVRLLTSTRGQARHADRPTADNIRAALRRLLEGKRKGDVVLVALSGHGVQLRHPRTGKLTSYFCPADARPHDPATLIDLGALFADLDRSGAGVGLLLVDACRNELAGERSFDADAVPRPPSGIGALFSCSSGQRAFETDGLRHGVFFYHVLQGLRGKAMNEDGEVTWDRLGEYVKTQVPRAVRRLVGGGARQDPHGVANLMGQPPVLLRLAGGGRRTEEKAAPPPLAGKPTRREEDAPRVKERPAKPPAAAEEKAPARRAVTRAELLSGEWSSVDGMSFRFHKNGTFSTRFASYSAVMGTYTYRGNVLRATYNSSALTYVYRLTWQDRPRLILADQTYRRELWKRVR
jgi:hypothetical protein